MMERVRSKSIDVGRLGTGLLNVGNLLRSSRKSFDTGSSTLLVPKSLETLNRLPLGRRKSVDAGCLRRPSRAAADLGSRRNLSYDAWIRAIRVSCNL